MKEDRTRASKFKVILVGAATLALAISGSLVGSATASAAQTHLGEDNIIGWEVGGDGQNDGYNYDQWHIGSAETPETAVTDSVTFNECSVSLLDGIDRDWTQVLKGYSPGDRPTSVGTNIDQLQATLDSISIDVVEGPVTIQVPFFYYTGPDDTSPDFFTLRNAVPFSGAGTYTLAGGGVLDATNGFGGGTDRSLEDLYSSLPGIIDVFGGRYEILGVGFNGDIGAEVASLSFDGDTHYFGSGNCATTLKPTVPEEVQTAAK